MFHAATSSIHRILSTFRGSPHPPSSFDFCLQIQDRHDVDRRGASGVTPPPPPGRDSMQSVRLPMLYRDPSPRPIVDALVFSARRQRARRILIDRPTSGGSRPPGPQVPASVKFQSGAAQISPHVPAFRPPPDDARRGGSRRHGQPPRRSTSAWDAAWKAPTSPRLSPRRAGPRLEPL